MRELDKVFTDDEESWIEALPGYQRNRIVELLEAGKSYEEVAELWLSVSPQNIAPFGAIKGDRIFLTKIQDEIEALLCGGERYSAYREKLFSEVSVTKGYVIGLISTAIAPVVGTSGTFIAPIIALILLGMGQLTINAWCETCKARREQQEL